MMHDQKPFAAAQAYAGTIGARIERFLPMVRKQAWHLAGSATGAIEIEDLMQAGLVALTEAAQGHDRPGEDGFAAYAKLRVRGAMVDVLRAASPDARGTRERRRRIEDARSRLSLRLGREPGTQELAAELGLAQEEYHRLVSSSAPVTLDSIDQCYADSDASFASTEADAEALLIDAEDREALIAAIAALPERLQMVIQLYFVEELNLSEIARVLDVSVPRVHQLKAAALEKLRASLSSSAEG